MDFTNCPLRLDKSDHSSVSQYPTDTEAYIAEESEYGAPLGPFETNPIVGPHVPPFMTRNKPNSDVGSLVMSGALGASVNAGIDNTYLDTPFNLTFLAIDYINSKLKRIGRGALLYQNQCKQGVSPCQDRSW